MKKQTIKQRIDRAYAEGFREAKQLGRQEIESVKKANDTTNVKVELMKAIATITDAAAHALTAVCNERKTP